MVTVNGRKYAETAKEFTDALFTPGGTCHGFAKMIRSKRPGSVAVRLYTSQRVLFAALGVNSHGETFVVTASIRQGRAWYMYACTEATKEQLGTVGFTYFEEHKMVEQAVAAIKKAASVPA